MYKNVLNRLICMDMKWVFFCINLGIFLVFVFCCFLFGVGRRSFFDKYVCILILWVKCCIVFLIVCRFRKESGFKIDFSD